MIPATMGIGIGERIGMGSAGSRTFVRRASSSCSVAAEKRAARLTAQTAIWVVAYGIRTASKCAVITVALTTLAQPAQARTQLNCVTTSVIITEKAGRDTSVQVEEHMSFWIDD
jgi:hypothetical protein